MKHKKVKPISAEEFDRKFDAGEDITPYMDFKNAVVVDRVNVDFPVWMIKRLDHEATKLNVSRRRSSKCGSTTASYLSIEQPKEIKWRRKMSRKS